MLNRIDAGRFAINRALQFGEEGFPKYMFDLFATT